MTRLLAFLLFTALPLTALAREDAEFHGSSFFGRMGVWDLSYETAVRDGQGGLGVNAHVEFMGTGLVSLFGNGAALEADLDFGLSFTGARDIVGVGRSTMVGVEASLGFPFALIDLDRSESPFGLRLQLAPGLGIGTLQTFGYVRARLTMQVAEVVALDLSYKWIPSRASHVWGEDDGLNSAHVRLALGVGAVHDSSEPFFVLFAEVVQSKFERMAAGPLGLFERSAHRNLLRLGAGMGF